MGIIVKKFGGTSVANPESRKFVYEKIIEEKQKKNDLVVVISAMGRKGDPYATDTLLDLVRIDNPNVTTRELDQIFVCGENISGVVIASNLQRLGCKSVYLSGLQAGIITDGNYTDSRVVKVNIERIEKLLSENYIVIVGGGQGGTLEGEITTLGRGGSDTSACELGVALSAESIEIYTDVEGIFTTDPRLVEDARIIPTISYDECIEMANKGAKVIHPRAVEAARKNPNTPFYVRSTFLQSQGTLICDRCSSDERRDIAPVGITLMDNIDNNFAEITIVGSNMKDEIMELTIRKLKDFSIETLDTNSNEHSMSFKVQNKFGKEALRIIHDLTINEYRDKY